ncbi:MAG TPA: Omp28-related outer membrane protein [Flavipsychrobacter sp.]
MIINQIRYGLAATILLFQISCTEKNTAINLSPSLTSTDTTYLASTETAQQKNVLVEEFTGVSCPPCPSGHAIVKSLKQQYPDRIVVIANHVFNFPQAEPVKGLSKQDFRTEDATAVGRLFGSVSYMPAAVIDRLAKGSDYLLTTTEWSAAVTSQIAKKADINLYLSTTFDEARKVASVKVKLVYTKPMADKHALTLAVAESNIIDAQKTQQAIDTFYTHNYVLRDIATPVSGTPIMENLTTKEAGRVIERTFEIPINEKWQPDNCKIVAFIHSNDGAKKDVFQSAEVNLKK